MKDFKIGFIGIGNIGFHVANNIHKNYGELVLYDINETALEEFCKDKDNVQTVSSPREVANLVDLVLISLPNPNVVTEVVLGKDGIIHGEKIKTLIDLSTSGEPTLKKLGEELLKSNIQLLDSPVSGGVIGAVDGNLSLMVAGEQKIFNQYEELLLSFSKKAIHVSDIVGKGQVMKVINNLLSSAALAITSEAMVLGVKSGLNPETMIDVLNVSSGRNSATEDKFKKSILNGKFDYGFATELAYKDMKLCIELAEKEGVPMFLGTNITHLWRHIMTQGAAKEDYTTIITYMEEWAGVQVRSK